MAQTAESQDLSSFKGMAENLLEEHDSVALVSAALRLLTKLPDQTPVYLTEERQYQPRAPKPRPRDIGYPGKNERRSQKSSRDHNWTPRKSRKER